VSRKVVLLPEAKAQLDELDAYLTEVAGVDTAARYAAQIVELLTSFGDFPFRGTMRDDVYTGLRTYGWKRKATIVFFVNEHEVEIAGIYYGGRDFLRDYKADE
jgi:toxin ParE1/3/4